MFSGSCSKNIWFHLSRPEGFKIKSSDIVVSISISQWLIVVCIENPLKLKFFVVFYFRGYSQFDSMFFLR